MERRPFQAKQQTLERTFGLDLGPEGEEDVVMESENTVDVHRGNSKWCRVVLVPSEVNELAGVFRIQDDIDIDRNSTPPTAFGAVPMGSILFSPADCQNSGQELLRSNYEFSMEEQLKVAREVVVTLDWLRKKAAAALPPTEPALLLANAPLQMTPLMVAFGAFSDDPHSKAKVRTNAEGARRDDGRSKRRPGSRMTATEVAEVLRLGRQ